MVSKCRKLKLNNIIEKEMLDIFWDSFLPFELLTSLSLHDPDQVRAIHFS